MRIPQPVLLSAGRWLGLLIPLVEAVLVVSGVLDLRTAVITGLVLELLLLVVVVAEFRVFLRVHRRARASGAGRREAAGQGIAAAFPPVVIRLARAEIALWRSLWWAVRRRRDVGPAELPLPYSDRFGVVTVAILCLGALELGVVHVLTARWPGARWALFALGVYALLWVLAFSLSLRQQPHLLRDGDLVLRFGHFRATVVPLTNLVAAASAVVAGHGRSVVLDGDRLALPVMSDTNVELRFDPPVTVEVAGRSHELSRVAFYADEPRTVVRVLRTRALS